YVVGTPQTQHLAMVFETARRAGWVGDGVRLEHVAFGSILGSDKKMLKTRAGESVRLVDLLDEAIPRAARVGEEKAPDLAPGKGARPTRPARDASAPSSTRTSRATGSRTTCSTGTACSPSTATPRPT